jgi:hypothetical protein
MGKRKNEKSSLKKKILPRFCLLVIQLNTNPTPAVNLQAFKQRKMLG